ncbi:MAG: hypothetical protein ABIQ44_07800, partial [Chloroflexia bacterium]
MTKKGDSFRYLSNSFCIGTLTGVAGGVTIGRVSDLRAGRGVPGLQAWLAWAVVGVVLVCAAPAVGRFVGTSGEWLDYPYPRAGSEGLILYESLLLKHGGDIYAPITPERFISGPYPPVFYWVAAAVLPDRLPDFSTSESVSSIFASGRIVSLVACIAA